MVMLHQKSSPREILHCLKDMKQNVAPGPDGLAADFYIHCWAIVGAELTQFIHKAWDTYYLSPATRMVAFVPISKSLRFTGHVPEYSPRLVGFCFGPSPLAPLLYSLCTQPLMERFEHSQRWDARRLSTAGRGVLIRHVLLAVAEYLARTAKIAAGGDRAVPHSLHSVRLCQCQRLIHHVPDVLSHNDHHDSATGLRTERTLLLEGSPSNKADYAVKGNFAERDYNIEKGDFIAADIDRKHSFFGGGKHKYGVKVKSGVDQASVEGNDQLKDVEEVGALEPMDGEGSLLDVKQGASEIATKA
ncbi:unnamed protein product [Calypogeia fissa]